MQPTAAAAAPATILAKPGTGTDPAALVAYYRQRAQIAAANFGGSPRSYGDRAPYILVEPENLLAMLGDGLQQTDREKLVIANREGQINKADLSHLTDQLDQLLFATANSHGAQDALHSKLLTLLRQYKPDTGK